MAQGVGIRAGLSVGELALVSRRLPPVRVSGAERVASAPGRRGRRLSPALVALLAPATPLLTPRAQLEVHLLQHPPV